MLIFSPNLRGDSPDLRGQSPEIRGQSPKIRGQSPKIRGTSPNIRGYPLKHRETRIPYIVIDIQMYSIRSCVVLSTLAENITLAFVHNICHLSNIIIQLYL